jgi:apolipoprotein N-acyltransferase
LLRCSNNGISCVVDADGTVIGRFHDAAGADIDVAGVYAGRLEWMRAKPTVYERWGDWIVLLSGLASGMLGVDFLLRRPARSRES